MGLLCKKEGYMSFVYAEKYRDAGLDNELFHVLCDTKTILTDFAGANLSALERDMLSKYGIVKSTICCPKLCVSFAGSDIKYAAKLFHQLKNMNSFELDEVSDLALSIHRNASSQNDIEFIISTYQNDTVHIDCIKENTIYKDIPNAHIGSEDAFRKFQELRIRQDNANRVDEPAYKHTTRAFQSVVDGGIDNTVGGITVSVIFDYQDKSFIYGWERALYTSKSQIVQLGEAISFHLSASDGGYSHKIVPIDLQNVLCIVDQMNPHVLYSSSIHLDSFDIENPNLSGLMMPMLVKVNEKGEYVRCR